MHSAFNSHLAVLKNIKPCTRIFHRPNRTVLDSTINHYSTFLLGVELFVNLSPNLFNYNCFRLPLFVCHLSRTSLWMCRRTFHTSTGELYFKVLNRLKAKSLSPPLKSFCFYFRTFFGFLRISNRLCRHYVCWCSWKQQNMTTCHWHSSGLCFIHLVQIDGNEADYSSDEWTFGKNFGSQERCAYWTALFSIYSVIRTCPLCLSTLETPQYVLDHDRSSKGIILTTWKTDRT